MAVDMLVHIRESNRIEDVWDDDEDRRSLAVWEMLRDMPELDLPTILTLHASVMRNLLPDHQRGCFRTESVTVSGRVCPMPADIPNLMRTWMIHMDKWQFQTPKHMHVWFEQIHPFVDGNGRVGRMLMWWHETRLGLEPTLIWCEDRFDYYAWFR